MLKQLFKRLFIGTHDLFWIEPYWNRWLELRTSLPRTFHLRACIRIAIATAIASIITIALFKLAVPNLGWNNIFAALPELLTVIPMLLVVFGIQASIPSLNYAYDNRIAVLRGQHAIQIKYSDIQTIHLSLFSSERVRLKIFYERNKKRRTLKIAISSRIDLEKLASLLPADKLTIHDRRR